MAAGDHSTENKRPTDYRVPAEVSCTQAKIHRAIALVNLSQKRLQGYAADTDGTQVVDKIEAMDLSHALDMAREYLDEAAEDCEEFTEVDSEGLASGGES
jgi:hypothetical protein